MGPPSATTRSRSAATWPRPCPHRRGGRQGDTHPTPVPPRRRSRTPHPQQLPGPPPKAHGNRTSRSRASEGPVRAGCDHSSTVGGRVGPCNSCPRYLRSGFAEVENRCGGVLPGAGADPLVTPPQFVHRRGPHRRREKPGGGQPDAWRAYPVGQPPHRRCRGLEVPVTALGIRHRECREITQAGVGLLNREVGGVEIVGHRLVGDRRVLQEVEVSPDTAAVLRWAGAGTADAERGRFVADPGQRLLHDEGVFPSVTEVGPVEQPVRRFGEKFIEAHPVLQDPVGAFVEHELHVELLGESVHLVLPDQELVQMAVGPSHDQLRGQQQSPPDRWLRVVQIDPDLVGDRLGPPSACTSGSGHAGQG